MSPVRPGRPELPPFRSERKPGAEAALAGIRVVDFTHFIAGPYSTLILADLGADVIKVEPAGRGDDFRSYPPDLDGVGGPFLWANRNKRSVALDLKTEAGSALARQLCARADVVIENFSTGIMAKLGLAYETLAAENEGLIYCAISAYGRDGPFADRVGFDPITQAESGFMSLNGFPDQVGVRTGPPVMDLSLAMMASNAVLAALIARSRTGKGQYIELALCDQAIVMLGFYAMNYLISGENPTRFGNEQIVVTPVGVFEAADGPLYLACGNQRTWERLAVDALGRPDLAEDPAFATIKARLANKPRLFEVLGEIFAADGRDAWVARLRACGVPAAPIRTVAEALHSPEVRERNLVGAIPHPSVGAVPNIAPSMRLAGTPVVDPVAPPLVGQHTAEVLGEVLGLDEAALEGLRGEGAFGPAS